MAPRLAAAMVVLGMAIAPLGSAAAEELTAAAAASIEAEDQLPPTSTASESGAEPAALQNDTLHAFSLASSEIGQTTSAVAVPREPVAKYAIGEFARQTASVPLEAGGLALGITALGVTNWKWGSSGFRFHSEGWFGGSSRGMDKLGHAYSTYVMTEFLTASIKREAGRPRGAEVTAAILAMGMMTYVEVFDGFSVDHGFSFEDLTMDAVGAGLSVLRSRVPALRRTVDFRLEYLPSGNVSGFHPISDYSGQRYLLAFQFAGVKPLARTPLRFVELQGGYYARGFSDAERLRGERPRRHLFVGVGLNVQELLFRGRPRGLGRPISSALDYVQVPYTAVYSR